jgi:hypothetical protein
MHAQTLIPDPRSRPWPKPIEYVYVSWLIAVVFGPMMLVFWALADDPTAGGSVLLMCGYLGCLALLVVGATAWTARKTGASWSEVTRAVRSAAPKRIRADYLGRRG